MHSHDERYRFHDQKSRHVCQRGDVSRRRTLRAIRQPMNAIPVIKTAKVMIWFISDDVRVTQPGFGAELMHSDSDRPPARVGGGGSVGATAPT